MASFSSAPLNSAFCDMGATACDRDARSGYRAAANTRVLEAGTPGCEARRTSVEAVNAKSRSGHGARCNDDRVQPQGAGDQVGGREQPFVETAMLPSMDALPITTRKHAAWVGLAHPSAVTRAVSGGIASSVRWAGASMRTSRS